MEFVPIWVYVLLAVGLFFFIGIIILLSKCYSSWPEADWPEADPLQDQVFERLPVGSSFKYLGATFRVASHQRQILCLGAFPGIPAKLICHYVDKNGVFRSQSFSMDESPLIGLD